MILCSILNVMSIFLKNLGFIVIYKCYTSHVLNLNAIQHLRALTVSVRNNPDFYNVLPELGFFIIVTQDSLDFSKANH